MAMWTIVYGDSLPFRDRSMGIRACPSRVAQPAVSQADTSPPGEPARIGVISGLEKTS